MTKTIRRANKIYRNVKQTNDATLDSRLLVNVSDLAYKKTAQLVIGDNSIGVDVDEFLSKCITFMRNGGPLDRNDEEAALPRRRTQARDDSDDEDATLVVSRKPRTLSAFNIMNARMGMRPGGVSRLPSCKC